MLETTIPPIIGEALDLASEQWASANPVVGGDLFAHAGPYRWRFERNVTVVPGTIVDRAVCLNAKCPDLTVHFACGTSILEMMAQHWPAILSIHVRNTFARLEWTEVLFGE